MKIWIPLITAFLGFLVAWAINVFRAVANHYQAVNNIYLKERINLAKAISKKFEEINRETNSLPIMEKEPPWQPFNEIRDMYGKYDQELMHLIDQYSFFFSKEELKQLRRLTDVNTYGPPLDARDRTDWFWPEDIWEGTANVRKKIQAICLRSQRMNFSWKEAWQMFRGKESISVNET